jgi:hypothetical protein
VGDVSRLERVDLAIQRVDLRFQPDDLLAHLVEQPANAILDERAVGTVRP